jgi:hypothetical protein
MTISFQHLSEAPETVRRWFEWMYERPKFPGCDGKDQPMYDYMDNFRFAKITDTEMCIQYEALRKSGCCGSVDQVIEAEDTLWLVGFNYGH